MGKQKRILFLDQLKAISILLIVYGHNDYDSGFSAFVSTFRLPLFFMLSGFVRKRQTALPFVAYVTRVGKRLLVPYFSIALGLYFIWLFVGRHYGVGISFDPWLNFFGILYAQGGPAYMDWGIPLWFLPALFCVLLLDYGLSRMPTMWPMVVMVMMALFGYAYGTYGEMRLPWSMDVAMVVYPFYFFGKFFRSRFEVERLPKLTRWLVLVPILILHLLLFGFNTGVAFYYGTYGNLFLLYLNGILGFMWMFLLFSLLPVASPFLWLGRNTLPVLAFHLPALSFMKALALIGFGVVLPFVFWSSVFYTLLQVLVLVPLIVLLNRVAPWMLGRFD